MLRLDPEQARMLASWLRMAAARLDAQAEHLRSCGDSFAGARESVEEQAVRARRLAERLG